MIMDLPCYSEALKMGKKKVGELLVPVKTRRAKKQAELEMCKLEEELATKQAALHENCTNEDVDFPRIIEAQDSIALLERKVKQYGVILEQMFPDE